MMPEKVATATGGTTAAAISNATVSNDRPQSVLVNPRTSGNPPPVCTNGAAKLKKSCRMRRGSHMMPQQAGNATVMPTAKELLKMKEGCGAVAVAKPLLSIDLTL